MAQLQLFVHPVKINDLIMTGLIREATKRHSKGTGKPHSLDAGSYSQDNISLQSRTWNSSEKKAIQFGDKHVKMLA